MALAETANLIVKLSLGGNFTSQIGKATASLGKLEKGSSRAYRAGQQIGTGIKAGAAIAAVGVGLLATQVASGLQSLIKLEQAQAQTAAVLKSTGSTAGITGREVTRLSEKYESLNAIIGDEFIRAGQNMLLTFTNIKKKAFEPALLATLNLNTAMGKGPEGLTKTAILVGKALNDPTKGLTALTRVGVAFTKEQVKRIKGLQKEGKLYEAQAIILGELNKEFGGSFAAQGGTTAGSVAKFGDAVEDLQRSLATALLPTVRNVADSLSELLQDPAIIKGAEDLGKQIGTLFSPANIKEGIGAIREGAGFLITIAGQVGTIVGTAVGLFRSLPPELQKLAIGAFAVNKLTGGLVTNLAGGLIGAVLSSFKGLMHVNAGVVQVTGPVAGGVPGVGGAAGAAKGGLGLASKVFLVGEAIGLALFVNEVRTGIAEGNTAVSTAISEQTTRWLAQQPTKSDLESGLAGVEQGIRDLESNPLNVLVQGEALDKLRGMRADIQKQLNQNPSVGNFTPGDGRTPVSASVSNWTAGDKPITPAALRDSFDRGIVPVVSAVASLRPTVAAVGAAVGAAGAKVDALKPTVAGVGTAVGAAATKTAMATQIAGIASALGTAAAGVMTASAARGAGNQVAGAIASKDLSVDVMTNVTVNVSASSVTKQVVIQKRYGPANGSSGQDGSGVLHNGAN